jgi:hypothetical protein
VTNAPPQFPSGAFDKEDDSDDAEFYAWARLVTHIDAGAIAALSAFYASVLKPNGVLLDLMSSWVSHLPEDLPAMNVVGHGMNADELTQNPRLTQFFVQDLNRAPVLPFDDATFDAVLCCVSVQYLQKPVEVFAEVRRILKPGAPFIVSFSNRCFPTKAVVIWRSLSTAGHAQLVRLYFEHTGFSSIETHVLADGKSSDPLIAVVGRA